MKRYLRELVILLAVFGGLPFDVVTDSPAYAATPPLRVNGVSFGAKDVSVYVTAYGAKGDGTTDDTAAIQAAINALPAAGGTVYVPAGQYKITSTLTLVSNMNLVGVGYNSKLDASSASSINVITATSTSHTVVRGLHIKSTGGTGVFISNGGVMFNGVSYGVIEDNIFENGYYGAILEANTSSIVRNNRFISAPASHLQGIDIYVAYASSRNLVQGNECISGNDTAISVQTITSSDVAVENVITGNVINNYTRYGIFVYKKNTPDTVERNIVSNNTVSNIVGSSSDDSGATHPFGAGIYAQGAEYTTITGNTVTNTNQNTDTELLAPGGIGSTNLTNITITGNSINNNTGTLAYGIWIGDPNQNGKGSGSGASFVADGGAVVANNIVRGITNVAAIRVSQRHNIRVANNQIATSKQGIETVVGGSYTFLHNVAITGNGIYSTTQNAIIGNGLQYANITNNVIDSPTFDGITMTGTDDSVTIAQNTIHAAAVIGIESGSSTTNLIVEGNILNGCATSIAAESDGIYRMNTITGSTSTDWSSTFATPASLANLQPRTLYTNTTGVTSVTTGEIDAQSYTLPANTLNTAGQKILCHASFVHAANANSASLKLYGFGTQITFRAMTVSGASADIDIAFIRTSSTSLRYQSNYWADTIGDNQGILSGLNFTTTNIIKTAVIGATTNGDMTAQLLRCELWP